MMQDWAPACVEDYRMINGTRMTSYGTGIVIMDQTSRSLISSFCSSEVRLGAPSLPSSTAKMVGSRAGREDLVAMSYIIIQIL